MVEKLNWWNQSINKPKNKPKYKENLTVKNNEKRKIQKETKNNLQDLKSNIDSKEKVKKINISTFKRKVLEPVSMILKESWYKNFDVNLLLKIWIIENKWWSWSEKELKAALEKISGENYKKLVKNSSSAWAKWIFQVMPKTASWLNRIYKIPNLISKNKDKLIKEYWLKSIDFDILLNALQWAFLLIDTQKNYWLKTEKELAWAYNMWPVWFKNSIKRWKLNRETSNYLKKMSYVSSNLHKYV